MSLNLTELKDESLGKQPIQAAVCWYSCIGMHLDAQQDVVAADDESSFTFDVDGLSDEALDPRPAVNAAGCVVCIGFIRPKDAKRDTQGRRA